MIFLIIPLLQIIWGIHYLHPFILLADLPPLLITPLTWLRDSLIPLTLASSQLLQSIDFSKVKNRFLEEEKNLVNELDFQ